MKQYRYVKSNAFTSGEIPEQSSPTRSLSLGNPAACIFTRQAEPTVAGRREKQLSPEQMQAIAAEHKGFVMEVVFCGKSDKADCKLTYYSSECEVDFCGHGYLMAPSARISPSVSSMQVCGRLSFPSQISKQRFLSIPTSRA